MKTADGTWQAARPPYPCITASDGCTHNLAAYLDMSQVDALSAGGNGGPVNGLHKYGTVLPEDIFLRMFTGNCS